MRLTRIYQAMGCKVRHIPLDDEGVDLSILQKSGTDVLHLMPSHQYPTGLVTSIARRYALLSWAAERPGRHLIEDDLDCEFRLAGKPIPALASIDAAQSVIYTNTFSKSLSSALRLAYMVLPDELMERFVRGDSSRNTEGNGLGLSIAGSLMELMHGKMQLFVDGDLFKVVLEFDRCEVS